MIYNAAIVHDVQSIIGVGERAMTDDIRGENNCFGFIGEQTYHVAMLFIWY